MSRKSFFVLLAACVAVLAFRCAAQDTANWAGSCVQSATLDTNGQYTCTNVPIAAPFLITATDSADGYTSYSWQLVDTTVTNPDGSSFEITAASSNGPLALSPVNGQPNCYGDSNGDEFYLNDGSIALPGGAEQTVLYYFGIRNRITGHLTCPTANSTLACSDAEFPVLCTLTLLE